MLRRAALAVVLSLMLATALAYADVPPPDECRKADAECSTAPPDYASPGICKASTCSRPLPDGKTTQYACNRCVPSVATKKKSGGCSLSPAAGERSMTPWLALAALALRGRRRVAARC